MDARERAGATLARFRGDRVLSVAGAAAAVWILLVLGFAAFGPESDAPRTGWERVGTLAAVLTPLALIAMAAATARALAALRAEAADLRGMLAALQSGAAPPPAAPAAPAREPAPQSPARAGVAADFRAADTRSPDVRAAGPRPAAARAAGPLRPPLPAAARPTPARPPEAPQRSLELDGPVPVPVDADDLIRAVNFPDGPEDAVAVQSLRAALRDPESARLIRAAQDVIMLLAERGLYMDDRPPAPQRPELWRRMAEGQRGAALSGIIAPLAPEVMETLAAVLRDDEVFRDAAHHFLRHWDRMLARELPGLDDARVMTLADTRSGRAYAVLAEAAGGFG